MSRVALLGGLGFCASHLCDALKAAGHYVMVLDNGSQAAIKIEASVADSVNLFDLADLPSLSRERFDYVFHCASPAGPARIKPGYALRPIIEGVWQGLAFAQSTGARFIKFSSSEVYGRAGVPLTEAMPMWVDPRYDARSEYAIGFIGAEALCFTHEHPEVQVLRLFNVVGPRQRAEAGVVIPRFCAQALAGEPLTIFGDGHQRRTFADVSDLVSFCLALMDHWPVEKRIWNVANPTNETSILDLAQLVSRKAGVRRFSVRHVSGTELTPHYRDGIEKAQVDISRARSIGWEPKVGLEEIVERCLSAST